jgi:hypothetical protein
MEARAPRVGLDRVDRVFLMEHHDQAYRVWRDAGVKNSVLVHIDAHHDMWWVDGLESITIGSFISLALKNNLVREMFWVVPDDTWRTAKGRQAVRTHVRTITKTYPGVPAAIHEGDDRISAAVLGKPLTVCSLTSMWIFSSSLVCRMEKWTGTPRCPGAGLTSS